MFTTSFRSSSRSSFAKPSFAKPSSRRPRSGRAAVCQSLESRTLLAIDITWVNRGADAFGTFYGASAAQARTVVDRALLAWEEVITSFNRSGGTNTYALTLNAAPISGRGVTNSIGLTNGKPSSCTVTMDDNGGGGSWYFDGFIGVDGIPDDGEFTAPVGPFTADGPAVAGADFFRTVCHEIGHGLGIYNGGLLATFASDNGDDPVSGDPADRLLGIDTNGNGVDEYTLTENGGGHLFEGGGGYTGPIHPNSLMNAGRTVGDGTRQLIGDVEADILRDALGYTVVSPNLINTFWANLNRTTNVLTVTGDINPNNNDNDVVIIDVVGTDTRIRVGGTTELIPTAEYTTLVVNAGNGTDIVYVDALPAGKGVTINGGAGNDTIVFSDLQADLDTGIDSDVSVNGGAGTDSVRADDQNDGVGADTYTITSAAFTKGVFTGTLNADVEQLTINGSNQPSTYNITGSTFNLLVNAGTGNDLFNVGGGDVDTNLVGLVTINGGAGTDRLDLEDATDGAGLDAWTFAVGSVNKGGQVVAYNAIEGLVVNASAQANTYNLNALGSGVPVTVNGGAGNETFLVGNGDLDTNLGSNVTLNGGTGTDSVTFNDATDGAGSNVYTLTATTLVKPLRSFAYGGFESLVITGSALAATYNVNGSSSATTVVNGGAGNDTVNVGGGDVDTNLGANITVNGGAGADVLTFDDTADGAGANTATFVNGQINKGAQTFVYNSFASLLWSGAALATTYNVNGTTPGTPVTINGGAGADVFNVGGGDFDSNVNGEVRVVGNGGVDRLVVNDTLDDASVLDTYEVNGGSFTKSSAAGIDISFGSTLLAGPPTIEEFVLNASDANSNIDINSTGGQSLVIFPNPPTIFPVAATINAGDGNDRIVLATGGNLTAIRGNISINGGAGVDLLTLNDDADADADAFVLTHNTLTNSDWNFTTTFNPSADNVVLDAGTNANAIRYDATAAAPASVVLNGNDGADDIVVLQGTATVDGGAGLDDVDISLAGGANTGHAIFTSSQDLGALRIFDGGRATVVPDGDLMLDANTISTLRGTLNLNDNAAVARATPVAFLVDKLTRGYNGGAWNGVPAGGSSGVIVSATAAASAVGDGVGYATIGAAAGQLNLAVFRGANVAAGNVALNYTLNGDTNLDRTVNFPDLVSLAQSYNAIGTNWVQGNSNYDNTTSFPDLVNLAQNYNASVASAPGVALSRADARRGIGLALPSKRPDRIVPGSLVDDALYVATPGNTKTARA